MSTETASKILVVLFFALLAFSAGTFVGKKVSESDHRRVQLEEQMREPIYGP